MVFVVVFVLFLSVAVPYGVVFFGKMHYMSRDYPMYANVKMNSKKTHNAEILAFGDSRIKVGFVIQNDKQLNLAMPLGNPIFNYYTLKRYLKHNEPPKIIILSNIVYAYLDAGQFWNRGVKFDLIDFFEFSEIIDNAKKLKQCDSGFLKESKCEKFYFFKYHFNFKNFSAEMFNAYKEKTPKFSRYKRNKEAWEYMEKTRGNAYWGRANGTSALFGETNLKEFKVNPMIDFYLHKIADLAKAHNIAIFHYQMPFNQSSIDKLDPKFKSEYNAFLNSMWQNYGIYSLNEIHAFPDSDFGDPSHLYNGANKSTADILQKIEHYFNPPNLEKNATFKNNANLENNATKTR